MNGTNRKHPEIASSFPSSATLEISQIMETQLLIVFGFHWPSAGLLSQSAVRSLARSLFGRLIVQRDELLLRFLCAFLDMLPQCRQIEGRMISKACEGEVLY